MTADPLADLARAEGLPSAHAAALAAIDSVLRDRGLRRVSQADVAAAAWKTAQATVQLQPAVDEVDEADLVAATVRMFAEVPQVAAMVRSTPGQALARLHAVWGRGILADDELGRVRTDAEVAERLTEFSRLMTTPTRAPALALAGIAHAELWSMAAFPVGSEPVALAVQQAVLIDAGVDPRGVIPIAAGHLEVGGHTEALRHYNSGGVNGVRAWLLHHVAAITSAVELSPLR